MSTCQVIMSNCQKNSSTGKKNYVDLSDIKLIIRWHLWILTRWKKQDNKLLVLIIFSSPELKAQVSFSDRLSSVVCLSVHPSICQLFLFTTTSQKPLSQFQQNFAQSILGWRGFKFVQMKSPAIFQGEIITK